MRNLYKSIVKYCLSSNSSPIEHRRLKCFLFITLIEMLVIPINLLGISGRETLFFMVPTLVKFAVILVVQTLFWSKHISLIAAIEAILIATSCRLTFENVAAVILPELFDSQIIYGNFAVSASVIIVAIIAHLRYLPMVMTAVTFACFLAFGMTASPDMLVDSLWYMLILFSTTAALVIFNFQRLKHDRELPVIDMDSSISREELKAMEMLTSRDDLTKEQINSLLNRLEPQRRELLISNLNSTLTPPVPIKKVIETIFPQLTASEIDICVLIADGYSLKQICDKLGKSESNITSQRTHIRKKLGLQRQDNLQRVIEDALQDHR
mgnify:CR=1 FL=1